MSLPTSPTRTRPSSPVKGASSRPVRGPLILSSNRGDPLKALPTDLSQKIFLRLSIKDLANCALVSKKWSSSQTLNYGKFLSHRLSLMITTRNQFGSGTTEMKIFTMTVFRLESGRNENQSKTGFVILFHIREFFSILFKTYYVAFCLSKINTRSLVSTYCILRA